MSGVPHLSGADMERYEVVVPTSCFNLWLMYNELTHSYEWVAGREYSLVGTNEEILASLKKLAHTDFFSVKLFEVYGERNPNKLIPLTCDNEIFDEVWRYLGRYINEVRRNNQKYLPEIIFRPITEITILIKTIDGRLIVDPVRNIVDLEREN